MPEKFYVSWQELVSKYVHSMLDDQCENGLMHESGYVIFATPCLTATSVVVSIHESRYVTFATPCMLTPQLYQSLDCTASSSISGLDSIQLPCM